MTKIKFEKKLEKELNALQAKCKVRTITMDDVRNELALIEEAWCYQHAKKDLEGVTIHYNKNAQTFPGAYTCKGRPEATVLIATFKNGGWECRVSRETCGSAELYSFENKELANFVKLYSDMKWYKERLHKIAR